MISAKFNGIDLQTKCRICLLKSGESCIFTLYGEDSFDIKTVFETYTGINVKDDDSFPTKLCHECLSDLITAHNFISKCKRSDTILRSLQTVLALEEPAGYKVVVVEGCNRIEFEYSDSVDQCIPVEEQDAKDESFKILMAQTSTEILLDNENNITDNCMSNCNDISSELDATEELQKCPAISTDVKIEEEYISFCTENKSDINVVTDITFNNSCEELIHSIDDKHQISDSCNDGKEIVDIDCETEKDKLLLNNEAKYKICIICSKGFKRKDTLLNHLRTHTLEKPYSCSQCLTQFSFNCNLIRHLRVHTGEKPYMCDVCGKAVTQSTSLKKHKQIHCDKTHLKPVKNILCSHCGLIFDSNGKFTRHLINTPGHTELANPEVLKKVLKHFCKICDRNFYSECNLNHHLATHAGIKNFLCSYCGKKFQTKAALNTHTLVHTGEKPYSCQFCSKTFTQRSGLKSHTYVHTGIKPFKCQICGKHFKQLAHLSYHSLLHTGEKRYACSDCGKKFTLKGNLKQHMVIHSNYMPYNCIHCNRGFKASNNMRKHLRMHKKAYPELEYDNYE